MGLEGLHGAELLDGDDLVALLVAVEGVFEAVGLVGLDLGSEGEEGFLDLLGEEVSSVFCCGWKSSYDCNWGLRGEERNGRITYRLLLAGGRVDNDDDGDDCRHFCCCWFCGI